MIIDITLLFKTVKESHQNLIKCGSYGERPNLLTKTHTGCYYLRNYKLPTKLLMIKNKINHLPCGPEKFQRGSNR